MERWNGKLAVVTGAGSGIGAATATALVEHGMIVVGLDVIENRLQDLSNNLDNKKGKFHYLKTDLTNKNDIVNAFSWIDEHFGGIHVFVNNAGILPPMKLMSETEIEHIERGFQINLLAVTICSKEAIKSMNKHNIDGGNIINIASVAGVMSNPLPGTVLYTASKKAVLSLTEGIRIELSLVKSSIKITAICPGVTKTKIFDAAGSPLSDDKPSLEPKDVVNSIIFCLQAPPDVHITELHCRPLGEDLRNW